MAYIGRGIENLVNTQKLDVITPATATGAGPYNLTKSSVAFVPASADQLVISINGVIQYGNFTVSGSTVTFDSALTDSDVCDFIYQMGTGLLTVPSDGSVNTAQLADDAVTTAKVLDSAITNAKLAGSIENAKLSNSSITINGSAVSLGGSVTIGETKPTITSISPSTIDNTQTSIVITGTNYEITPQVEFINISTGIWYIADTVTRNSSTQLTINATLAVDGNYKIRIENPDGNAVLSSTALLTVSDAPTWSTAAGSLGSVAQTASGSFTVSASSDSSVTYSKTSGNFPTGFSLDSATGVISGTEAGSDTQQTDYNFTITATDAESQTASRAFTITVTTGLSNGGQF